MWPMSRIRGAARPASKVPTTVDAIAAFGVRPVLDGGAETLQEPAGPGADLVDAGGRVAAAVDVHELLEVREIGRAGPRR